MKNNELYEIKIGDVRIYVRMEEKGFLSNYPDDHVFSVNVDGAGSGEELYVLRELSDARKKADAIRMGYLLAVQRLLPLSEEQFTDLTKSIEVNEKTENLEIS